MGPLSAILSMAAPAMGQGLMQLFGGKRRKKEEDAAMGQMQQLASMFKGQVSGIDEQMGKSYMENSDVQDALRQLEEMGLMQNQQIDNQSEVMGTTDEAKIAAMGATKKAQAGGLAQVMGGANQYRNMLFGQRSDAMRGLGSITGAQYQAGQQNRQNFNQSLQNIFGPLQSGINAGFESGAFKIGK